MRRQLRLREALVYCAISRGTCFKLRTNDSKTVARESIEGQHPIQYSAILIATGKMTGTMIGWSSFWFVGDPWVTIKRILRHLELQGSLKCYIPSEVLVYHQRPSSKLLLLSDESKCLETKCQFLSLVPERDWCQSIMRNHRRAASAKIASLAKAFFQRRLALSLEPSSACSGLAIRTQDRAR